MSFVPKKLNFVTHIKKLHTKEFVLG